LASWLKALDILYDPCVILGGVSFVPGHRTDGNNRKPESEYSTYYWQPRLISSASIYSQVF
jgi:hypothetical protein